MGAHTVRRTPAHRASRWSSAIERAAAVAGRPAAALVAATAFTTGAVVTVSVQEAAAQARTVEVQAQQSAAEQAEEAYRARVDTAATTRLSTQATAYLMHERADALTAASQAAETAATLAASSTDVLSDSELSPLQDAVAELSMLVETTTDAESAVESAVATITESPETEATDQLASPQRLPVEPGQDALDLVALSPTEPGPDPAAIAAQAALSSVPEPNPATADDAASVSPVAHEVLDGSGDLTAEAPTIGFSDLASQETSVLLPAAELLAQADLDLADTAELRAAVDNVLSLSTQVENSAQATRDRIRAEEEARAAARAAAARRASLVQQAAAAPNGQIPSSALCGVNFDADVRLRCDAAPALEALDAAYRADTGHHLAIVSSYRTLHQQQVLRRQKGGLAARPGTSVHGLGLAVDFGGAGSLGQFNTPVYRWLKANAGDYGWYHPSFMDPGGSGPLEPWHWQFNG